MKSTKVFVLPLLIALTANAQVEGLLPVGVGVGATPTLTVDDLPYRFQAISSFAPFASPEQFLPNTVNLVGTGASLDPQILFEIGSSMGMGLLYTAVPVLPILQDDPSALPDYFLTGGGILTSYGVLTMMPPIPLLNSSIQ